MNFKILSKVGEMRLKDSLFRCKKKSQIHEYLIIYIIHELLEYIFYARISNSLAL